MREVYTLTHTQNKPVGYVRDRQIGSTPEHSSLTGCQNAEKRQKILREKKVK